MNVHFAVLALLADGPRSSRWLREEFTAGASGLQPPDASQVYPALTRLTRAGLVEPGDRAGADDAQHEFRITAGGQRALAGWLRSTPAPGALPGGELVLKIQLAGQVPGTDVHEVIQAHRRQLIELLQRRTRARLDGARPDEPGPGGAGPGRTGPQVGRALASYAELYQLDSVIRWLDAAEGLLGDGPAPAGRSASSPPADHVRISDAEREQALSSLRDHFAEGRLTRAELDERLTTALSARTAGDLRRLLADLPPGQPL
jgi:DNA-binding PadR family transcriptional regulator